MITLFLILCYFILIFNIIIPIISEKMRLEYNTYIKYKKIKNDYICVDDKIFSYDFGISGIVAKMALDSNKQPLHCANIKKVDKNKFVSCNSSNNNILHFDSYCSKAYLDIFFST
ncbi:MV entry-fusion complex protein [Brazilian porcupinepox virus 1]|nr:MV entry-fusion complex protein [Brazilian porcupinepox virus 1]